MELVRQDEAMSPATIPTTLPAGYDQSGAKPTPEHVREPVQRPARDASTVPSEVIDRLVVHIAGQDERASIEDLDNSMKLGCGHPMGPLTLLDFVGLDTTYYISQIMFDEFKERRFAAPPLLKRMVLAGWNGRKSGRGFYDYSDPQNPRAMKF